MPLNANPESGPGTAGPRTTGQPTSRPSTPRFSKARFSKARFSKARFSKARFSKARFSKARFSKARFSKARPGKPGVATAQLELRMNGWGGARRGAGAPKKRLAAGAGHVGHLSRPRHSRHHPVHVTLRVGAGLPSLRHRRLRSTVFRAFGAGAERFGFRLVHFSVQSNHLHLVVEANDRRALTRGMQGLAIRVAKAINRRLERRGKVFADRYHARALRSPREVRHALRYVLLNAQRHGVGGGARAVQSARRTSTCQSLPRLAPCADGQSLPWLDPCSSAALLNGWGTGIFAGGELPHELIGKDGCAIGARPKSWLLGVGWRRAGPLDPRW